MSIKRIEAIRQLMDNKGIDLFYSENPIDFFYLLDFQASKGVLLITSQEVIFFVDARYFEKAVKFSSIQVLLYEKKEILTVFHKIKAHQTIAFPGAKLSYDRVQELFSTYFPHLKERWISQDLVEELRMVKDQEEISRIKKACEIGKKGFDALNFLSFPSEKMASQAFKEKIIHEGADTFAFEPIIAFDRNAAIPHHSCEQIHKKPKNEILIDCGAKYQGYHGDMTQTILLEGASDRLKELYAITLEGYEKIFENIQVGLTFESLTHMIHAHFKKYHVDDLFLHSLGHGIGIDLHEAPFYKNHPSSKMPIQENMVFTLEPGLYDPKVGGVRLENTLLMTNKGPISLTGLNFLK
jgi:Xaa-Pro aminopeptidase